MKNNKTHNKALQPIANAPAEFKRYACMSDNMVPVQSNTFQKFTK